MTLPASLATLLLAAPAVALPQSTRSAVQVTNATIANPLGSAVATEGDLTAVMFEDDGDQAVYVATSDGRALEFGPPIRVDSDAGTSNKHVGGGLSAGTFAPNDAPLAVRGGTVFAAWRDERNTQPGRAGGPEAIDVYVARSTDGGATWSDQPVPKGYATGGVATVLAYAMTISADGQHVYVAQVVDPDYFSGSTTELWLSASHDGGATFEPAIQPSPGINEVNTVALALDGDVLHVAYVDRTYPTGGWSYDVFHTAAPFGAGFPAATQVDLFGVKENLAIGGLSLAARGGVAAIAWIQNDDGGAWIGTDPYIAISTNGGATFSGPQSASTQAPYQVTAYDPAVAIDADGDLVYAWADDRNGGVLFPETNVFVRRSADGGATWSAEVELGTHGSRGTRLTADADDLVLTWVDQTQGGSAFSRDGGDTWSPELDVSGVDLTWQSHRPQPALGALYDNALVAYIGYADGDFSSRDVFVGGYRLPAAVPQGFTSGGTAHVELSSFSGDAGLAWVVFSTETGDLTLPFGDGRNLGLSADALLLTSLANPSVLLATVAPDGSGQTASFAVPFAPGTELFAAAVSLDLGAAVALDEVTDAAPISVE